MKNKDFRIKDMLRDKGDLVMYLKDTWSLSWELRIG